MWVESYGLALKLVRAARENVRYRPEMAAPEGEEGEVMFWKPKEMIVIGLVRHLDIEVHWR